MKLKSSTQQSHLLWEKNRLDYGMERNFARGLILRKYKDMQKLSTQKASLINKWVNEPNRALKRTPIETQYFKCSASLDISRTIRTALGSHHTCQNDEHQEDKGHKKLARMWERGILAHCWCKCKLVQPLWKSIRRLFPELKIGLGL